MRDEAQITLKPSKSQFEVMLKRLQFKQLLKTRKCLGFEPDRITEILCLGDRSQNNEESIFQTPPTSSNFLKKNDGLTDVQEARCDVNYIPEIKEMLLTSSPIYHERHQYIIRSEIPISLALIRNFRPRRHELFSS